MILVDIFNKVYVIDLFYSKFVQFVEFWSFAKLTGLFLTETLKTNETPKSRTLDITKYRSGEVTKLRNTPVVVSCCVALAVSEREKKVHTQWLTHFVGEFYFERN